MWVGLQSLFEIGAYTPTGDLTQLVRRNVKRRPVSAADTQQAWDSSTGVRSLREPSAQENRSDVPFADFLPAFQNLMVDREGNLWVQEYLPPWDPTRRWAVFDPSGLYLGTLDLPDEMRLMDAGSNSVVGIFVDEFDVEQVQVYV